MMRDYIEHANTPPRMILVALDGSEWSFKAAGYAIKIAKMAYAEIVCIHAILNPPYTAYATVDMYIRRYIEDAKMEAEGWYNEVSTVAKRAGIKISAETLINVSSVVDAITSYAVKNNIDLIVMGTKGRSGLKKYLLGSVASGVISHAQCAVLVVK
jgi:nucleotide-binding universal stress UspA family protein